MSFSSKKKNRKLTEINMTPFVDVMLVLLIIFIISAPLMQYSFDVKTPNGHFNQTKNNQNIQIILKLNGDILISQQSSNKTSIQTNQAKLISDLNNFTKTNSTQIDIIADKDCKYSDVIKIVETLSQSGFFEISFITTK